MLRFKQHFLGSHRLRDTRFIQSANATAESRKVGDPIETEVLRWNRAMTDHMRHGRCDAARRLFDQMPPRRTSVSWNIMISGYLSNNRFDLALTLFHKMPCKDVYSHNIMLTGYVRNHDLASARRLFDGMLVRDVVSWNAMLSAYAQNGLVEEAREVFETAPVKNAIMWNGILAAYLQNGRIEAARRLFDSNPEWELVSWNAMIAGYMRKRRLQDARKLFDLMVDKDVVSWNTMISGYAQNGQLSEARSLFELAPHKDVFSWTAMVSGYTQNDLLEEARKVFEMMPQRNAVSWNAMIAGYVQHRKMEKAKELFDINPCRNTSSWNTMLTGYAKAGEIDNARKIFDEMPQRDSISWSAMIAGYSQGGFSEETLRLFIEMKRNGTRTNRSSFTCVLSTCADIAMLDCGKQLHGKLVKAGYEAGCFVGNALLAMYCKCGCIDEAYCAFQDISEKDIVSWNTMISGYARHGFGKEALGVFETMEETAVKPDVITLVAVLSACSHAGLIERGMDYFYSMQENYGVTPKAEHYTCMIDLLGRAGRLSDAENLLENAPFEPDSAMWGALLGASRKYGNTRLGEKAAERIFRMEPDNSGMYVLLSNLYAAQGKWSSAGKLRVFMRDRGVKKVPGFSWIEVKNKVHTFSVGDSLHPESEMIYAFLEEMNFKLKKAGYVSSTKMVLHDVEEEEKEHMLKYHSEKLAIAYGILNIPPGRPIRVIKNLRVCEDCHNAIKHISAIENRLIILRDSNRFHHFNAGVCSCGDYW